MTPTLDQLFSLVEAAEQQLSTDTATQQAAAATLSSLQSKQASDLASFQQQQASDLSTAQKEATDSQSTVNNDVTTLLDAKTAVLNELLNELGLTLPNQPTGGPAAG